MAKASTDKIPPPAELAEAVFAGDRRALARALTLVESTREDHQILAAELMEQLAPFSGTSIRIGISGVPGVGKSTFIEAFGRHLLGLDHRVAVLSVDPTSALSGGSILADKTRMPELAREQAAFIRPSPAGTTLGGVGRHTPESIVVCEAGGFDVVIVETVGVGQSETAVADMTDMFLLLLLPDAGSPTGATPTITDMNLYMKEYTLIDIYIGLITQRLILIPLVYNAQSKQRYFND